MKTTVLLDVCRASSTSLLLHCQHIRFSNWICGLRYYQKVVKIEVLISYVLSCLYNHHYYCFRFLSYFTAVWQNMSCFPSLSHVICFINQQLNMCFQRDRIHSQCLKPPWKESLPTWIIKIRGANRESYSSVHAQHIILKLIYKINYEEQLWKKKSSVLCIWFYNVASFHSQQYATNNTST